MLEFVLGSQGCPVAFLVHRMITSKWTINVTVWLQGPKPLDKLKSAGVSFISFFKVAECSAVFAIATCADFLDVVSTTSKSVILTGIVVVSTNMRTI